ncbi:hypothetical protein VE02_01214 [Pseudogymnoascus sp. 03VT05]|nr:hypothetical protein VE02_01214 [Pseudogymnoascus sp. 03VT05]
MRFTVRGFVRVICCLYLPVDETKEANTTDRQKDDDWLKPVSGAGVISELDAVPVSRPARSTLSRGIRRASTAITGRLPTPNLSVPTELPPRRSNNNQEDASTQTGFDDCLGQNGSQTSRHRTSLPTNLRVGRAVLSGSVTDKRRIGRCSPIMEEQTVAGQVDLQESQGHDVREKQGASILQRPRENAVRKRTEAAQQYIAYHPGN